MFVLILTHSVTACLAGQPERRKEWGAGDIQDCWGRRTAGELSTSSDQLRLCSTSLTLQLARKALRTPHSMEKRYTSWGKDPDLDGFPTHSAEGKLKNGHEASVLAHILSSRAFLSDIWTGSRQRGKWMKRLHTYRMEAMLRVEKQCAVHQKS